MPARERPSAAEYAARTALVIGAVLLSLLALELGIRASHGVAALGDWSNEFLRKADGVSASTGRVVRDELLGHAMRPNFLSPAATHDSEGFRIVPGPTPSGPPLLVVGDSYAYGDDVTDAQAWPAQLQSLTDRRVVNAGVVGYGLDQTLLRLERLAPTLRPSAVIVAVIADDVSRLEMSRLWSVEKPYFALTGRALELRNSPVPPHPSRRRTLSLWHRLLGWSYLVAAVETRLLLDRHEWAGDSARALPRGSGERLVCPLMQRLARVGVPTLVVAFYEPRGWRDASNDREQRRLDRLVLDCAEAAGLATLDLRADLDKAVTRHGYDAIFYGYHLTAEGNRVVTPAVAAELKRRGML